MHAFDSGVTPATGLEQVQEGLEAVMMINEDDAAYFRSRADEEQDAADQALSDKARDIHLKLASGYQQAAKGCSPFEERDPIEPSTVAEPHPSSPAP